MRPAASLAYLLARTSDTIADAPGIDETIRLESLDGFAQALGGSAMPPWPERVLEHVTNPRELLLLQQSSHLHQQLNRLPAAEASLVREVVGTILQGQTLDIRRFASAGSSRVVCLPDVSSLEDYTWLVAGCVGAFWTRLGFLTLGRKFSSARATELEESGILYGKGLQLVNILRDLPEDLANGRCYLPDTDPHKRAELMGSHQKYLETAHEWIRAGFHYSKQLNSHRLRVASVLPAMLARETLDKMKGIAWETLEQRVKIPRSKVYSSILKALAGAES